MSAFDDREPYKKRVTTVSLTAEQRKEFDLLKGALGLKTDGALIKLALSRLSHEALRQDGRGTK